MLFVLTKPKHFHFVKAHLPDAECVESCDGIPGGTCLIGYSTGVIAPPEVLGRFSRAYNFHGASPDYPGRDPHHWASYDGAADYGATAHIMSERVDEGAIVGVIRAGVPKDSGPEVYRQVGEDCLQSLFCLLAHRMANDGAPAIRQSWVGTKRSRADLIAICNMKDLSEYAREHREMAFAGFEQHFIK